MQRTPLGRVNEQIGKTKSDDFSSDICFLFSFVSDLEGEENIIYYVYNNL